MEGPRIRLAFTIDELSAMALGRSARSSIIVTTNAWRAGVSNALITPWHTWRPSTIGDRDDPGQRQHGQRQRLQHREHLGDDQHPVPVPAVHEDAGDGREEQRRDLAAEPHDAEQQRRAGQPVDEPARRDAGDPGADEREALPGEEQPVVPVPERAEDGGSAVHTVECHLAAGLARPRCCPHLHRVLPSPNRQSGEPQPPFDPSREALMCRNHKPLAPRLAAGWLLSLSHSPAARPEKSSSTASMPMKPDSAGGPSTPVEGEWRPSSTAGRSTRGGVREAAFPPGWQVVDGALTGSRRRATFTRGSSRTSSSRSNGRSPGGNSGIMYRVTEGCRRDVPTGPRNAGARRRAPPGR